MKYAFKVWLFFYILSIIIGFGLIGRLPFPIPLISQIFIMGIGFVCLLTLDKQEKKVKK